MRPTYRLVRSQASADEFHRRSVPDPAPRELWLLDVDRPALVLGSSQPDDLVDREACERAGVEVVRRRSGGGAVLLIPGEVVWLDVIVPRGAPGWSDDVHGPMRWFGGHLAAVVGERLPGSAVEVHHGAMVSTAWSSTVCFDGIGAGEVALDGSKLVGISQRRMRHAARLQCCWYSGYEPERLVALLAPRHRPPVDALSPVATLPVEDARAIPAAVVQRLAASPGGQTGSSGRPMGENG